LRRPWVSSVTLRRLGEGGRERERERALLRTPLLLLLGLLPSSSSPADGGAEDERLARKVLSDCFQGHGDPLRSCFKVGVWERESQRVSERE